MSDPRRHAAPAALVLSALIAVSACTAAGSSPGVGRTPDPTRAPVGTPASPGAPASTPTTAASASAQASTSGVVLAQAWATAPIVDVSTGEAFRIADHAGKVIIVETMAIWCGNCRAQQGDVQAALARLPAGKVVYVVLDTDKSENDASLAAYRTRNGFDGRYAVAGKDIARALAADFGDEFLNPPSTPMLIIGTDGTVTRTEFGHKSADDIVALAEAHGA